MDNAFFNEQSISFEITKFQTSYKKGQAEIKAIILLGDSSQADKAVFLLCITFIEFLRHFKVREVGGRYAQSEWASMVC